MSENVVAMDGRPQLGPAPSGKDSPAGVRRAARVLRVSRQIDAGVIEAGLAVAEMPSADRDGRQRKAWEAFTAARGEIEQLADPEMAGRWATRLFAAIEGDDGAPESWWREWEKAQDRWEQLTQ